jgi:hypothetical protein
MMNNYQPMKYKSSQTVQFYAMSNKSLSTKDSAVSQDLIKHIPRN